MDIFIPAPGASLPGVVLPDASITPVNDDGTLNHADIALKRAYINISPYGGIELGHQIMCIQAVLGGTWYSFRDVTDPEATVKVLVRPVDINGGAYTVVSYKVTRADGSDVGHSGERYYDVT